MPVKPDPVITAINRYRAASAELDKIAVREPTLPNGNPADETEEYVVIQLFTIPYSPLLFFYLSHYNFFFYHNLHYYTH